MGFLDIFAILILLVLGVTLVGVWVLLGMMPGRIARGRNHPQADAVRVCGWWGVLTMGLLLPVAFIWAYYKPVVAQDTEASDVATSTKGDAA
ncbi:Inner membrane protein YiaW [Roseimaritima multifibrata]|uniref:Inner membrane protein YiaW n=1 Tax=Roseimaritima multifibrata TaxID=1930274 RepID=A0A517MIG8_9BACT|nr:DUF3302 domain-containing protein [Roseimaritima multifibrata]QDS94679.1 Inner membrane protein YiaW [Roseimaritima multifibrata]